MARKTLSSLEHHHQKYKCRGLTCNLPSRWSHDKLLSLFQRKLPFHWLQTKCLVKMETMVCQAYNSVPSNVSRRAICVVYLKKIVLHCQIHVFQNLHSYITGKSGDGEEFCLFCMLIQTALICHYWTNTTIFQNLYLYNFVMQFHPKNVYNLARLQWKLQMYRGEMYTQEIYAG